MLTPPEPFEIAIEDGVYVVSGERIERLAAMTDFDNDEALGRFEAVLPNSASTNACASWAHTTATPCGSRVHEFDYS